MKRMIDSELIKKIAEVIDNNGALEASKLNKKLYCHPINIGISNTKYNGYIACLIFNNDPTPFTIDTFKEWLDNLYTKVGDTIRVILTGGIYNITSTTFSTACYLYKSANSYGIIGMKTDGGGTDNAENTFTTLFGSSPTFNDGVNEIYPNA